MFQCMINIDNKMIDTGVMKLERPKTMHQKHIRNCSTPSHNKTFFKNFETHKMKKPHRNACSSLHSTIKPKYFHSNKSPKYQNEHKELIDQQHTNSLHFDNQADPTFQLRRTKSNRSRLYSREVQQEMNRKNKEIRSSRYKHSIGIYDLQNYDRKKRVKTEHTPEKLIISFQPTIKNLKASVSSQSKITIPYKSPATHNYNSPKNNGENTKPNIFLPSQQSQTGVIIHKFKPNLRNRHIEDNLHVMASILKKKTKVLQKKQIIQYVSRIMNRCEQK